MKKRIIVAITGASGAVYAKRLVEVLAVMDDVEVFLVASKMGKEVLQHETGTGFQELAAKADHVYREDQLDAAIASGSFHTDGMIVVPCSMKTMAAISHGISANLITRAADVTLKEGRRLVIVPRETPLSLIHVENMRNLILAGATVLPAMPGFYHKPDRLEQLVDQLVGKMLTSLGFKQHLFPAWGEWE